MRTMFAEPLDPLWRTGRLLLCQRCLARMRVIEQWCEPCWELHLVERADYLDNRSEEGQ